MRKSIRLLRNFSTRQDNFGNIYVNNINNISSLNDIIDNIKMQNPSKGIIIDFELHNDHINNWINSYNAKEIKNKLLPLKDNKYLIKNNSNCPELINGNIFTSGICSIINHENENYLLLVKTKNNHHLILPSGIHTLDNLNITNTAIRELHNITYGNVLYDHTPSFNNGFDLDNTNLIDIFLMQLENIYYDIDDVNVFHNLYLHTSYSDEYIFHQYLFQSKNKDSFGNYRLQYINNPKVDYIIAVKLYNRLCKNFSSDNAFYSNTPKIVKKYSHLDIYSIDLIVGYYGLYILQYINNLYKPLPYIINSYQDKNKFNKMGISPYVKKITFKYDNPNPSYN